MHDAIKLHVPQDWRFYYLHQFISLQKNTLCESESSQSHYFPRLCEKLLESEEPFLTLLLNPDEKVEVFANPRPLLPAAFSAVLGLESVSSLSAKS